jgi:hypothetical protein
VCGWAGIAATGGGGGGGGRGVPVAGGARGGRSPAVPSPSALSLRTTLCPVAVGARQSNFHLREIRPVFERHIVLKAAEVRVDFPLP